MGRILLLMMGGGGGGRILPTLSPYSEIGVSGVERTDEKRKTHRKAGMDDQCVADCAEAKYPWGHDGIAVQDLQARMCGGGAVGEEGLSEMDVCRELLKSRSILSPTLRDKMRRCLSLLEMKTREVLLLP